MPLTEPVMATRILGSAMEFDTETYPSIKLLTEQVAKETGKDVLVSIDEDFGGMLSTQVTARSASQPVHLVRINVRYHHLRHALAAYQLRTLLHRYHIKSPEKDLTLGSGALKIISNLLQSVDSISPENLPRVSEHIAGGLVTQLRSVLPAVAIHKEIQTYQPELAEQQKEAISATINENLQSLSETPFPKKLVNWNRAMAAVESYGLAKLSRNEAMLVPFEALGLVESAKALVAPLLLGEYADLDDRDLVEMTASHIGMTELHQWI